MSAREAWDFALEAATVIRLPASQVRERFAEILDEVINGNEQLIIQRHGKDVAALISTEDLERFQELEDLADLREMAAIEANGEVPVPWEGLKAELGLKKQ
jgi:prevent-host-death family protein